MSTAIIVPDTFKGPVAPVFAGAQAGDDLSGGITGGYGLIKYRGKVWSIQHHGNTLQLMRDDGDGPRGSIDVVIIKANAQLSKTWYESGWDETSNNPPDCASANGVMPDAGVPKRQSDLCATCPKNAWGSAPSGGKGKACGDHRRLAVVPLADLRNETFGGPLLLRCPAASLQDMAAFDSRYKAMGYPYFTMGLKIGFDPAESFPKFTFNAIRPLSQDEGVIVVELRNSPETARVITESSAPAVAAVAAPAQGAFLEAPPPNAIQPQTQQVAVRPVAAAAPAPAQPQPTVTPPAVVRPAGVPTNAGGFGPVGAAGPAAQSQPTAQASPAPTAAPAPTSAPVQTAKPAVQMTGFGAAAPELPLQVAQPVQQVVPATPAPAPEVVSAFEGSLDDRLSALLAD